MRLENGPDIILGREDVGLILELRMGRMQAFSKTSPTYDYCLFRYINTNKPTPPAKQMTAISWEKGSKIITIDMQEKKNLWLEIFKEAQQRVQALVRERQLVVEVNPSSNRNIGPMEKMADHPIFQLTLDKQQRLARQIRVTINTDDPGVFATSLTHEFYLLGEILLNRGIPEAEVVEWLEWLRKNGKEYSFLRVLPHAEDENIEIIIDSLFKKYTPILRRLRGEKRQYKPPKSRIKLNTELEQENRLLKTRYKQLEARIEKLEKKLPKGLQKQD